MEQSLLVLLAEMLKKQEQHSEILKNHSEILKKHSQIMTTLVHEVKDQSLSMVNFFDNQKQFNTSLITELKEIKGFLSSLTDLNDRMKILEQKENKFEQRLSKLENLLNAS
ncbi:MAG: hypothetical protein EAZ51_04750 [Sphingobacteriales bacterium]|nr:MAG: hypothetical protein EAZ64_04490 [Sphingobacteriales bacterium]TAF81151.1 MAG: hypothetical protein EAZ51_04750 [Sphingobacteriales bacterium]